MAIEICLSPLEKSKDWENLDVKLAKWQKHEEFT
jgi:hypothetical protein